MSKRRGRERELSSRPAIADVRESADGVEAALNQIPELAGLQDEIKQVRLRMPAAASVRCAVERTAVRD